MTLLEKLLSNLEAAKVEQVNQGIVWNAALDESVRIATKVLAVGERDIERVARVLAIQAYKDNGLETMFDGEQACADHSWHSYVNDAKAALTAAGLGVSDANQ